MKFNLLLCFALILAGCAGGRLEIYNVDGKVVGECVSGFDWHPYGVNDSVDWVLNYCARQMLDSGCDSCSVSNPGLLERDYSLPEPPEGENWNKRNAWQAFSEQKISERHYGYVLASIETIRMLALQDAEEKRRSGAVDQKEYLELVRRAEAEFSGE